MPNGVTLSEIDAAPLPNDPADVVYVGRLIDEKRVDLLLELPPGSASECRA